MRAHCNGREPLGILAWTRNSGRLNDIGRAFGVQPRTIGFSRLSSRWSAPLRYGLSTVLTIRWLIATRPRAVLVSCPPPFAALIVAAYARMTGARFLLDAHPGAFGHRDRLWAAFVPLQLYLMRHASATMITCPALEAPVEEAGGRPLVFHEAPPQVPGRRHERTGARPRVLFATVFDPDEPLQAILECARELDETDIAITGDPARMPVAIEQELRAVPHVRLTGWLSHEEYLSLVLDATVVVALTSDPHSVMRSAFEAICLERPTVLSDTATLRDCFSPSVFVEHSAAELTAGVRRALAEHELWGGRAAARREALLERWAEQQAALSAAIWPPPAQAPARREPPAGQPLAGAPPRPVRAP